MPAVEQSLNTLSSLWLLVIFRSRSVRRKHRVHLFHSRIGDVFAEGLVLGAALAHPDGHGVSSGAQSGAGTPTIPPALV